MNALKNDRLHLLAERLLRLQVMTGMGEGTSRQCLAIHARRYRRAWQGLVPDETEARTPRSGLQPGSARATAAPAAHAAFLGQGSIARMLRRPPARQPARLAAVTPGYGGTRRTASLTVAPGMKFASRIAAGSDLAPSRVTSRPLSIQTHSVRTGISALASLAIGSIPVPSCWTGTRTSANGPEVRRPQRPVPRFEIRAAPLAPRASAEPATEDRPTSGAPGGLGREPGNAGRPFSYEVPASPDVARSDNDLGRWMMDYLERQLSRPQLGMTGVDPRVSPL